MKKYKFIVSIFFLIISLFWSCNESDFLEEEPLDFFASENSYSTPRQIEAALTELYRNVRDLTIERNATSAFIFQYTADYAYNCIGGFHELNSWSNQIIPESGRIRTVWQRFYKIVANANVILGRIEAVEFTSEDEKNAKIAEAKFFRAWAYRGLGILFGGVPLVVEEIQSPKRDFVRASRTEIWDQVINDLVTAIPDLSGADDVVQPGRISRGAANHLLTEMYIITQEYDRAIAAATEVIDNSGFSLMTGRFGSRSSEEGDVYWDLFRIGNQNREGGNTEGIWVSQYEFNVIGGGNGDELARFLVPLYWQLTDSNGENLFTGPNSNFGGRGIGWWTPSDYYLEELWQGTNEDIRNSEYNIIRDIEANNPNSAFFGQPIVASGAIDEFPNLLNRWWNPIIAKAAPIGNFPDELIVDKETGLTTGGANHSYRDRYMMRLAETYLLRAEAYFLSGDPTRAAADINMVRNRANADPVAPADVDLDYILDERARELFAEELRLLTLMRTGTLIDRIRRYNPYYNGTFTGADALIILDHQNVWPIPNTEIERNTQAVLEQNPGYTGF